jgi:hypothetical protein
MSQLPSIISSQGQRAGGHYPFSDVATLRSRQGIVLPSGAFTDARLYPVNGQPHQYLSKLTFRLSGTATVEVSDDTGVQATADFTAESTSARLLDAYGREVGILLGDFQRLMAAVTLPATLTFALEATEFAPAAVIPNPQTGVIGLEDEGGLLVSGEAWLVGEYGITLRVDGDTVTVHATGDRLYKRRQCGDEQGVYVVGRPLTGFIVDGQDVLPDENGNVAILPGDGQCDGEEVGSASNVLRVAAIPNGIQLRALGIYD